MQQTIIVEKLPNGVEVAVEEIPSMRSVSFGFFLKNGSRHETDDEAGLSHFLEHLVFKGSELSSCRKIAERIDLLGGNVDAFTSREFTSYVAKVTDTNLNKAMSLLAEVIFHPAFSLNDVELERDVVLEEIKMVQDSPDDLVHELFLKAIYGEHPLGRSILGTADSVSDFNRDKVLSFFGKHYRSDRLVVAVAGNVKAPEVIERASKLLGGLEPGGVAVEVKPPELKAGKELVERANLEQVQLLLGVKTFSMTDRRRRALEVMNTYLGASVSSRLFQNVRERLGLAYTVSSCITALADNGFLSVYAATSPDRVERLMDVIRAELESLARGEFSERDIRRVKSLIKSDVVLSLENSSNRMALMARQLLYFKKIKLLDDLLAKMDAVTRNQVAELAEELLSGADITVTAIGNLSDRRLNTSSLSG